MTTKMLVPAAILSFALAASPAAAKDAEPPVTIAKCASSYGSIAVVDGETQGWTRFGLGSPRDLIAALAAESGCFSAFDPASGQPATYLLNVIAGDKEEVDRTTSLVSGAGKQAANRLVGGLGGRALGGLMGGLGGRRKTVAAGLRLISPASGQTLLTGTGEVSKTTISIQGLGTFGGTGAGAYGASKDGQMLVEAFIKAFNAVSGQGAALAAMMPAAQQVQDVPNASSVTQAAADADAAAAAVPKRR